MPHMIHYSVMCRRGYGNVIGIPSLMERREGGTSVRNAELTLTSASTAGPPLGNPAHGRLALGSPRNGWRIEEHLEVPTERSHVVPIRPTDEVASFVVTWDPGPTLRDESAVTMAVHMWVDSPMTIGATHYPVRHGESFAISFGEGATRPRVFVCCDFGPIDGLRGSFTADSSAMISTVDGPWPTGRTLVPVPQDAAGLSVRYTSPRREMGPPASVLLEWFAAAL